MAKFQGSLQTVQEELEKVKATQNLAQDGKPFVPPEILEELRQVKLDKEKLQVTVQGVAEVSGADYDSRQCSAKSTAATSWFASECTWRRGCCSCCGSGSEASSVEG